MALKGTILKKEITDKILATFEGSFLYNDGKEIRIPGIEDGQELQVKVALTCAKTSVSPDGENALPGEEAPIVATVSNVSQTPVEATQEEKDNIKKMMEVLGL
jgi:hypothetical protein